MTNYYWNLLPKVHSSITQRWLAYWPLVGIYHQNGKQKKIIEILETMLSLEQKQFESELIDKIKQQIALLRSPKNKENDLTSLLKLAEDLHYL